MIGAIIENNFRFTNLNSPTGCKRHGTFHSTSVVQGAIGGPEILQEVFFAFTSHFRVNTRSKWIWNAEIVTRRATEGNAESAERKSVGRAVGIFDYELRHLSIADCGLRISDWSLQFKKAITFGHAQCRSQTSKTRISHLTSDI